MPEGNIALMIQDASPSDTAAPRADAPITAAVLIVGNEILSGRTRDTNLAYLGRRLTELGIRVAEARVVADVPAAIIDNLNALRHAHRYVFTTGGIGPTHDDITAGCVAEALGRSLVEHPEARAILDARYGAEGLTEGRLRMARMPEGADLVANPVSAVPGFKIDNVHVLAGIPQVMQAMFESLAPGLVGGPPLLSATVVAALREGDLAGPLGAVQERHPETEIGSYPFFGERHYGANIVIRSADPLCLEEALADVRQMVRDLGAVPESETAAVEVGAGA